MSDLSPEDRAHNMSMATMVCGLILLCFVIGSITYSCTQPNMIDQDEQAKRIIENNKMISCVRAGGSWLPVKAAGLSYVMSCVTSTTLELTTKMNLKD